MSGERYGNHRTSSRQESKKESDLLVSGGSIARFSGRATDASAPAQRTNALSTPGDATGHSTIAATRGRSKNGPLLDDGIVAGRRAPEARHAKPNGHGFTRAAGALEWHLSTRSQPRASQLSDRGGRSVVANTHHLAAPQARHRDGCGCMLACGLSDGATRQFSYAASRNITAA